MPQHTHAIHFWEIQVEDYQVVLRLAGGKPCLLPILKNIHAVLLRFKALPDKFAQRFIVFRDKNSHKVNRP